MGPLRNRILDSIRPQAQEFFRTHADIKPMNTGDVIFEDGAPVTHVVFPHEGVVSIIAEMSNGRSVEKSSIGPEGFLGFSLIMGGGSSLGRSVVQVPGQASWVTIADLDVALEEFQCVREIMLRYAKSHTVQLMESVACNSLHTAEQRVARWLLHAHDRVEGDTYSVTQEAIAMLLALRRATVNAICTDLMNAGAISYHRGSLRVTNRAVLHERACECYERIRLASL
ncbi:MULTISPECIES: Crp/Fnr family transcriptional regulator [unclassified Shinella]|uniref:Crp/Fnr family transcriptional regulator n=2 Tax=unclassified Shinella TaxID=2643062 RepID=UPI000437BAD8|nr:MULTISPECIES: Crp/Fnr family transcriptional regulator [unclassified Shinella]MCA0338744.1 Crp/Fnr family transcriptional regulator [Pseudomonadota bacterium]EYR84552.1 Crp/FNR family transcriptional regulator [Shinella sp. DD12]KNY14012.1 Crp/Fnr family transcriptional regulator [Shinella sp. SUS2]KOC73719.1 Crp/Fnr family transcriptional regulator [Shinella sp. GWS1]MCO5148966.1 Crp/Fnr family transcriptional regulator [Shinella sp.]